VKIFLKSILVAASLEVAFFILAAVGFLLDHGHEVPDSRLVHFFFTVHYPLTWTIEHLSIPPGFGLPLIFAEVMLWSAFVFLIVTLFKKIFRVR
jgi:hypothetical protein